MITFCPIPDLEGIARLLDDARLNAQRTEAGAILKWLRNPERYARFQKSGYCTMWQGHEEALAVYYNAMLREWLRRGGKTVVSDFDDSVLGREDEVDFPSWWKDERLHTNHRVALLCKDPEHYGQFFCEAMPEDRVYNYIWPEWDAQLRIWNFRPPKAGKSMPKSRSVRVKRLDAKAANSTRKPNPDRAKLRLRAASGKSKAVSKERRACPHASHIQDAESQEVSRQHGRVFQRSLQPAAAAVVMDLD